MSAVKMRKKSRRKIPTKQGFPDEVGYKKPPKNRQFGKEGGNPRHSGAWKKEDTLRYKLEKLINGLDDGELEEVLNDPKTSPGVRRLATLLYKSNYEKPESEWRVWESAMNQAYGLPKQSIEQTNLEPPVSLSPRNAPTEPGLRAEGAAVERSATARPHGRPKRATHPRRKRSLRPTERRKQSARRRGRKAQNGAHAVDDYDLRNFCESDRSGIVADNGTNSAVARSEATCYSPK